jgi:hypothetical protein
MSQQLHLAVTGTAFARLYILGPNEADITSVTDTLMKLDTEPRELVARLVPAPEPLSAISPLCRHHHREPSRKI